MTARVCGVIAAATASGSMLKSSSRTSTNTGRAPAWRTQFAVAAKENAGTMTSSSG